MTKPRIPLIADHDLAGDRRSGPAFDARLTVGLSGALLAAMVAGLNNRVPSLLLADLQGALGFAYDDASWLNTAYVAGELAGMPFTTWFAITFSLRRFHLAMLAATMGLSAILPRAGSLGLVLGIRALQGLFSGTSIPLLMMPALRLLPPSIRLHRLALYALTATFAPNVAPWLATAYMEQLQLLRWAYWHVIPLVLLAMGMVAWGIPQDPTAPARLRHGNWPAMAMGVPGLALLAVAADQGVRLNWFRSPLIVASLLLGGVLTVLFVLLEWRHPNPFVRLQMLARRNLWLGFSVFLLLLMISATAVALPMRMLAQMHGFRLEQAATVGLTVGLPQLALGSGVALLLYQRRVDARHVFAAGLACIAAACWLGSGITNQWMVAQFINAEILYALGQPMAIIPLLFLATSAVQPSESPHVAGIVNTIRSFGLVLGGGVIGQLLAVRGRFHQEMLLDHAGYLAGRLPSPDAHILAAAIGREASVLAAADAYRIFGLLALVLIPVVLTLRHTPAPAVAPGPSSSSLSTGVRS